VKPPEAGRDAPGPGSPARAERVHRIPGRLRLRVRARRGEAAWFEAVTKALEAAPRVDAVRANPATGSILVQHRGEADALEAWALEQGWLEIHDPEEADTPAGGIPLAERLRRVDPQLARLLEGPLDLRRAAALGLGALGSLQAARGQALPAGLTLLMEALKLAAGAPGAGTAGTGPGGAPGGGDGATDGAGGGGNGD